MPTEHTPWWSVRRLAECAVHLVVFSLLWLVWSLLAGEPYDLPRMLLIGGAIAAGLTWGLPLFSGKKR